LTHSDYIKSRWRDTLLSLKSVLIIDHFNSHQSVGIWNICSMLKSYNMSDEITRYLVNPESAFALFQNKYFLYKFDPFLVR
jgi:hypothetical protein